jgi:dTDP-4-amino-4,6-dideoxygalactose transaminase
LKTFEFAAQTRRRAADRMRQGLSGVPGLTMASAPHGQDPIWLYLPVLINQREFGLDRDALATALEKENLFVRKYYSPPCHLMAAYRGFDSQALPRTEASSSSVVSLPVYNDMTTAECDGIVQAIVDAHRGAPRLAHATA